MPKILLPAQAGSLGNIDVTQGEFRQQLDAVTTLLRQLGGAADSAQDLLVSRFTIYVNPEIGRDTFVGGDVNAAIGLSMQEATCGYSPFAPFKSLQRAFIEAARISIIVGPNNDTYDRVVIRVASGNHIVYNGPGGAVSSWGSEYEPTEADLQLFNGDGRLGAILPRGVSVIGEDLRKAVVRPAEVPAPNGNPSTGRGAIFRATGGGFFFSFTFKDKTDATGSHHLLHCFEFCNQASLTTYYDKVATAFGLNPLDAEIVSGETQIAAPYPDGPATSATDTTFGASCYVFNCSLRSDYGLCGMYLDGDEVTGFKSMVTAQFTNVSLQKDMQAWQVYSGGAWGTPANYQAYIDASLNNVRYRVSGAYNHTTGCYATDWRHFGFKVINNAIIQEVSCFVIGDAVHHWTASGGECTITNSNSNFGATALLSSGFKGIGTAGGAFSQDDSFAVVAIKRPAKVRQDGSNIRQLSLGLAQSYDPVTGVLTLDRAVDPSTQLALFGYSLAPNTYLWIENKSRQTGPGAIPGDLVNSVAIPVRALMDDAEPWDETQPNQIKLQVSADANINNLSTLDPAELPGNRVYIRRLVDNRTAQNREYSLTIINSKPGNFRRPLGNYIVRLGGRTTVGQQLDPVNGSGQLFIVTDATPAPVPGTSLGAASDNGVFRLIMRPGDSQGVWENGKFYRIGQAVFDANRVKRSRRNGPSEDVLSDNWADSFSMLPSIRGIEQSRLITAPALVVDRDSDPDPDSVTLGIDLDADNDVLEQVRSAPDFIAIAELMLQLGYTAADIGVAAGSMAGKILQPQSSAATRDWDPRAGSAPTPNGKLTAKVAWPLEFNRPSLIRAFGHAYEWAGYMNYTKAMPKYQTSVLSDQLKVDFFAVNHLGGRCYNTGFNEDGLIIQGDVIQDLSTGRSTNVDVAGLGGLSGDPSFEDVPTTFKDLTVTDEFNSLGRANFNNVVLSGFVEGSPQWSAGTLPAASTATQGIAQYATPAQSLAQDSDSIALTPFGFGQISNQAGGWVKLDAGNKIPVGLLPNIGGGLLPGATTTSPGIIEISTNAEAFSGLAGDRALVPSNITALRNQPNGLAGLGGDGLVGRPFLPAGTAAAAGIVEFATEAETAAQVAADRAMTPAGWGALGNVPLGWLELDAGGLVPANRLPSLDGSLLPAANETQAGIIETATDLESLTTSRNRAVVPANIQYLRNIANGLAGLDAGGLVLRSVLPIATEAAQGSTRYSSDAQAISYAAVDRSVTPANIGYLRNRNNGLAGLDSNGRILLSAVPPLSTAKLPVTPAPWVVSADNFAATTNFTWSHAGGANLLLGAPVTTGYTGVSGFILVTNATSDLVTGINNAAWVPILNTWVDPATQNPGLPGDLLISYYVAAVGQVIYNVTMVT